MRNILRSMFLAALLLLAASPALADSTPQLGTCFDAANVWCVQPATAVGWQLNLKNGDFKNAVVLVGYTVTRQGNMVLGAGIYGGMGYSADSPNAFQSAILVSAGNFGAAGFGVQAFKGASGDMIYQGVLTVAANFTLGGTTSYVREASK